MGTTTHGITYPDASSTVDVAGDMQELAEDVDALLDDERTAWSTYTPVITATSGSPTLGGSPTIVARYKHVGRTVRVKVDITLGSSPNLGTAGTAFSLPVTPHASAPSLAGVGVIIDASPTDRRQCVAFLDVAGSKINLMTYNGTFLAQTAPWTWVATDVIRFDLCYEAAANP